MKIYMRWQKIRTVSPGTHQSSVGGRLALSFFSIFPNHADLTISRTRVHIHSAGVFLSNKLYIVAGVFFFFFIPWKAHLRYITHIHMLAYNFTRNPRLYVTEIPETRDAIVRMKRRSGATYMIGGWRWERGREPRWRWWYTLYTSCVCACVWTADQRSFSSASTAAVHINGNLYNPQRTWTLIFEKPCQNSTIRMILRPKTPTR